MQTEEKDALTELYARNVDAVYRICYVYLRSRADAEDAVQSVFLKYLQKRPAFRGPEHEQGWLLLTAKNVCRDMLRAWWRRQRVGLDELPEPAAPAADGEIADLLDALLALPENIPRDPVPVLLGGLSGKGRGRAAGLPGKHGAHAAAARPRHAEARTGRGSL